MNFPIFTNNKIDFIVSNYLNVVFIIAKNIIYLKNFNEKIIEKHIDKTYGNVEIDLLDSNCSDKKQKL